MIAKEHAGLQYAIRGSSNMYLISRIMSRKVKTVTFLVYFKYMFAVPKEITDKNNIKFPPVLLGWFSLSLTKHYIFSMTTSLAECINE
jgi:hypothetical protein